eukprot:2764667-Prymnesium_polylepis.1
MGRASRPPPSSAALHQGGRRLLPQARVDHSQREPQQANGLKWVKIGTVRPNTGKERPAADAPHLASDAL